MPFNSIAIDVEASRTSTLSTNQFATVLPSALNQWRKEGKRAVWLKLIGAQVKLAEVALAQGFKYHHAKNNYVMMALWLPSQMENKIPPYNTHAVGVGGFVLNSFNELLVIKERTPSTGWKLPGGWLQNKENFGEGACREVWEECGVQCKFKSVLALRTQHGLTFDKSDMYVICQLTPVNSTTLRPDPDEISDCRWMPLSEFVANTDHPMHHRVAGNVLKGSISPMCESNGQYKDGPVWNLYAATTE